MTRKDWLLLAVATADEPLTPAQLQKVLFLMGQRLPDDVGATFYKFRPYNYGPFSSEIYQDADLLGRRGLVRVESAGPHRRYGATEKGRLEAERLRSSARQGALHYLDELVAWARRLSFQQLVSAIYKAYPEQRVNSIFVEPPKP